MSTDDSSYPTAQHRALVPFAMPSSFWRGLKRLDTMVDDDGARVIAAALSLKCQLDVRLERWDDHRGLNALLQLSTEEKQQVIAYVEERVYVHIKTVSILGMSMTRTSTCYRALWDDEKHHFRYEQIPWSEVRKANL